MSIFGKMRDRFTPEWKRPIDHEKYRCELFERTPEALRAAFGNSNLVPQTDRSPGYPRIKYLGEHGLHAFMWTQNMEVAAYPKFFNIVCGDDEDLDFLHFQRGEFTSFIAHKVEFLARNVYLLTNDSELLNRLSKERFSPNPPWIMYPDLGPFTSYNQGEPEYWDRFVWTPFWQSLSAEERDVYFANRAEAALAYMSQEEWDDWVYSTRKNDPE
jgi:hypothetical protein